MEKTIIAAMLISCLSGCIGVQFSLPDKRASSTTGTQQPTENDTARAWCGMTLWAGIPLPLKLPVCKTPPSPSPLYACGPFMFLGPLMHGYEGNFLCGKTPF
ncbi:hypothetical protein C9383_05520 [Pseudomonas palleroniana]|uniref:Uncharacterized protein n=1 Tax=Pseudomonas palleroniana TaxID=191390 RepID=A0A1H5GUC7_9PSED|nr:hypothetical protein F7R03_27580 [Pseudomonas palleroniana]PTC30490.1 hypothetical protein C9383_05520 [Pseudomonas palleroniana]SEE18658.1 hypothetical protein SAMN04490198_0762 [Pseudomonas palleroniana]